MIDKTSGTVPRPDQFLPINGKSQRFRWLPSHLVTPGGMECTDDGGTETAPKSLTRRQNPDVTGKTDEAPDGPGWPRMATPTVPEPYRSGTCVDSAHVLAAYQAVRLKRGAR